MIASLIVVLHVLSVFWLVAGILGRGAAHALALKASDLGQLEARHEIASFFERASVRPASFVVLATGLLAAWLRGWPPFGILQGSPIQWPLVSLVVYLTIFPLIIVIFLPRGRIFRAALEGAKREGKITPELRASLADSMVAAGRGYEVVMIVVLTVLMVAKPF